MDLWKELLCLTADAVLFSITYNNYVFFYNTIFGIKKAQLLGINPNPDQLSKEQKKCVIVRGTVQAMGELLPSFYSPHSKGVIQKVTITEHAISKNSTGFWLDRRNVIQEIVNTVPFTLQQGHYKIEIVEPTSAYQVDLETVATKFESVNAGFIDGLVGFFSGVRQRGIETTEEMLKEGSVVTAVGEIENTPSNSLMSLSPPSDGSAYYLTMLPVPSLLRKLESEKNMNRLFTLFFGLGGVFLSCLIAKKCWFMYQRKIEEQETKKRIEEARRLRRLANRDNAEDLPEEQRCVVCRVNPREIILLPCGHCCICEDCSANISNNCPICRSSIKHKSAFFL